MATTVSGTAGASAVAGHTLRPSFLGLMRGEWLKVSRQWSFWIMLGLMVGGYILVTLIYAAGGNLADRLRQNPQEGVYSFMELYLFLLRVFWGMMVIILTARLIGMEYSGGTIRVLLGRGVGRLQLLFAKLSVLALIAVVGGALLTLFATLCGMIGIEAAAHNLDLFKAANATFWSDARLYAASVLISLLVSILMAAAVTTVTRSLAAGLSVSIIWFPIDNLSILPLMLGAALTKWSFWTLVSGDFLGLNLDTMATQLLSNPGLSLINTFAPLTPVTGAHTLLVTGIYAVAFLVAAVALTALRDVKE
jgi:ABC-type transport system involved in multi-copper enzyme maturation permease subunit